MITVHQRRAFRKKCEMNITLTDGGTSWIFFRRNQQILIQNGLGKLTPARVVRVNSRGMLRVVVPIYMPAPLTVVFDECQESDDMIDAINYFMKSKADA